MGAATRFDTQQVGALPVSTQYLARWGLADAVNDLVPWEGEVPSGTPAEVLIANRLLRPPALFRVDQWAQSAAAADYFDPERGQLDDGRPGRALERLAAHAGRTQAALVLAATREFEPDVSRIHYGITDVELFGAYGLGVPEGQSPPAPLPARGRTRGGRKNVKRIQAGVSVTGDGGVPVAHAASGGNAAGAPPHLDNLRRLKEALPRRELLDIADTKPDTPANLPAAAAGEGQFLCGGAFSPPLQQLYLRHRRKLRPVDYHPESQEHLPPQRRDRYEAFERTGRLRGEVAGQKAQLSYRLILVWSQAKARQEAATRERHTAKTREGFEAAGRNPNRYSLKAREALRRRLEAAKAKYGEGGRFEYELARDRRGQFPLQWKARGEAPGEWKLLEGVSVPKTNRSTRSYPTAKALAQYKEQGRVGRRTHHLKGPLAVAPLFLKSPERIAGLLCLLVWALMVLALMGRQVRRGLKGKPLLGLYPENRPGPAPAGPALLDCFRTLCVVIVKHRGTTPRRLAEPTDTQRTLLRLLGIPPDALRTFKPRCGM